MPSSSHQSSRKRLSVSETADILISIRATYVDRILSGEKKIELRRKMLHVPDGARVWIYTKAPEAKIGAYASIERIITGTPDRIWKDYRATVGVSLDEFRAYFAGSKYAFGLVLKDVRRLEPALNLNEMRKRADSFHPPQFFKRLRAGDKELKILESRLT
jgi:predicted transcriptional regulator